MTAHPGPFVPMADSLSAARAIKTALATPLVALGAVLLAAGVMRFVSFSALEQLAFDAGARTDPSSLSVTLVGVAALMGLLLLLAFFDVPLPMFTVVRRGPQRALVLEAAAALTDAADGQRRSATGDVRRAQSVASQA